MDNTLGNNTFGAIEHIAVENAWLIQELHAVRKRLRKENLYLRDEAGQVVRFETIIGKSPGMQEVYELVERVLSTTATVLIRGESGTGKELVARVIHDEGPRAKASSSPSCQRARRRFLR